MHNFEAKAGVFYGVGVGPGDPLLITLKAHHIIQSADVICYLSNQSGTSQARDIAQYSIGSRGTAAIEVAIPMPMSTDRTAANAAYDLGAKRISSHINLGQSVVFLCEGDPLFFGSFSYLLERLSDLHECLVVPGISSVNGAAAALQQPLTLLQESFVVMSGRHSDAQLEQALISHDSVVIMKAGRARPRILAILDKTKRTADANYLAYIGRESEEILTDVSTLANEAGPYFSLFVILKQERDS
jgi:precorrin-2/cobalt-factor-2 C20-methyltransferase|tara:strand:+ start:1455 stop:2186 length:732 start_codon:yes stop_codon:yes gene_type:complete